MRLKTEVEIKRIDKSIKDQNGNTILNYQISFPVFRSAVFFSAAKQLSDYYAHRAKRLESFCKTALYHMAQEEMKRGDAPLFSLCEEVEIPFRDDGYISLFFERSLHKKDSVGAPERAADTWSLFAGGKRLFLHDFFSDAEHANQKVLKEIERQIHQQTKKGKQFYRGAQESAAQSFLPKQFYLTDKGMAVFFQPFDITPPESGIPVFLLPYREGGPQLFPRT